MRLCHRRTVAGGMRSCNASANGSNSFWRRSAGSYRCGQLPPSAAASPFGSRFRTCDNGPAFFFFGGGGPLFGFNVAGAGASLFGFTVAGGRAGRALGWFALALTAGCALVWMRAQEPVGPRMERPRITAFTARVERVETLVA